MKHLGVRARLLLILAGAVTLTAILTAVPAMAAEEVSSIARGGQLYDNWFVENKTGRPDEPQPNFKGKDKYAKDSWRCKECHGWDYAGKDGAYGKGSHATGVGGILGAKGKDPAAVIAILKDGNHGYTDSMMTAQDLTDLANFVSKGAFDMTQYIDAGTKAAKGDVAKGEIYYNTLCAGCHGLDGKKVTTGAPLGAHKGNPFLMMHKALNGQPNEAMPALRSLPIEVTVDLVTYVQTLSP